MKNPWPYDGPYRLLRAFGVVGRFWIVVAVGFVTGWPGSIVELVVVPAVIGFLMVSAAVEAWRMISTSSEATLAAVFGYGLGVITLLYIFFYEFDEPDISPVPALAGVGVFALTVLLILELLSLMSVRTSDHSQPSDGSRG